MKIRDHLAKAPVTVPPRCSCREAAELMAHYDVGALLVVDAGLLLGIVTDRDLVVRGLATGADPATPVRQVMTVGPVTVQGGAELSDAEELMDRAGIRRLPVLEDGEVAGLLSRDDLISDGLVAMHPAGT
ncbi:MAG TPA: CBS domain-containing protein [Acidimicrobiales bacterium]|nr:CBS domain-containing protein [Acidimicrobiales bacterium]